MSETILDVDNLGKRYMLRENLGRHDQKLKGSLELIARRVLGMRPPENMKDFWALRNVSFSVKRGEVLGIIGRNGSGKSTLLRLIARLTHPSEGNVRIGGTVGSYLGLGAGMHPELTGRENIFMGAAALGMPKRVIRERLDDIIAFSELGEFMNTPVKFYSSGMQGRLAFSVAMHLDHGEILIIDEALATGDIAFCQKCFARIRQIVGNGQTVLFTSHSPGQIRELSTHCLYLKQGQIAGYGDPQEMTSRYEQDVGLPANAA